MNSSLPTIETNDIQGYSTASGIAVDNAPENTHIYVYTLTGILVADTTDTRIALPQGMYIVKVGGQTRKVIKD